MAIKACGPKQRVLHECSHFEHLKRVAPLFFLYVKHFIDETIKFVLAFPQHVKLTFIVSKSLFPWVSQKCLPIVDDLCSAMRWWRCRAVKPI